MFQAKIAGGSSGEAPPSEKVDLMLLKRLLALHGSAVRSRDTTIKPEPVIEPAGSYLLTKILAGDKVTDEVFPLMSEFYDYIKNNDTLKTKAMALFGKVAPHLKGFFPNDGVSSGKPLDVNGIMGLIRGSAAKGTPAGNGWIENMSVNTDQLNASEAVNSTGRSGRGNVPSQN